MSTWPERTMSRVLLSNKLFHSSVAKILRTSLYHIGNWVMEEVVLFSLGKVEWVGGFFLRTSSSFLVDLIICCINSRWELRRAIIAGSRVDWLIEFKMGSPVIGWVAIWLGTRDWECGWDWCWWRLAFCWWRVISSCCRYWRVEESCWLEARSSWMIGS